MFRAACVRWTSPSWAGLGLCFSIPSLLVLASLEDGDTGPHDHETTGARLELSRSACLPSSWGQIDISSYCDFDAIIC